MLILAAASVYLVACVLGSAIGAAAKDRPPSGVSLVQRQ
jgi:hypothetical protein